MLETARDDERKHFIKLTLIFLWVIKHVLTLCTKQKENDVFMTVHVCSQQLHLSLQLKTTKHKLWLHLSINLMIYIQ